MRPRAIAFVLRLLEWPGLRARFLLAVVVLLACSTLPVLQAYDQRQSLRAEALGLHERRLQAYTELQTAYRGLYAMGRALRHMQLAPIDAEKQRSLETLKTAERRMLAGLSAAAGGMDGEERAARLRQLELLAVQYVQNTDSVVSVLREAENGPVRGFAYMSGPNYQQSAVALDEAFAALGTMQETAVREAAQAIVEVGAGEAELRFYLYLALLSAVALLCALLLAAGARGPLVRLRDSVEAMAGGQLDAPVAGQELRNETGELARSVARLQQGIAKLDTERWVQATLATLASSLQGAGDSAELASLLMQRLAPLLHIAHGELYVPDPAGERLVPAGGYAVAPAQLRGKGYARGEGLVGQCALERRVLSFERPVAPHLRTRSGLGDAAPAAVLLAPVILGEVLLGVLELALRQPPGECERALLDAALPQLAISLGLLRRTQARPLAAAEAAP